MSKWKTCFQHWVIPRSWQLWILHLWDLVPACHIPWREHAYIAISDCATSDQLHVHPHQCRRQWLCGGRAGWIVLGCIITLTGLQLGTGGSVGRAQDGVCLHNSGQHTSQAYSWAYSQVSENRIAATGRTAGPGAHPLPSPKHSRGNLWGGGHFEEEAQLSRTWPCSALQASSEVTAI